MKYYSGSQNAFYDPEIFGPLILQKVVTNEESGESVIVDAGRNDRYPLDVVEISDVEHARLMQEQFEHGKVIQAGPGGYPETVDRPPKTIDDLRATAAGRLPAWEETERGAGIDHAGHRWLTTPAALQDVRDVLLAGVVPGGQWVTAARVAVPMDLTGLQELWAAIATRGALIYRRRLELEALIPTLTREQLEAFVPGWPAVNAG